MVTKRIVLLSLMAIAGTLAGSMFVTAQQGGAGNHDDQQANRDSYSAPDSAWYRSRDAVRHVLAQAFGERSSGSESLR